MRFLGVHAIGKTDTGALPVRSVGPAVAYYTQVLGFSLVSKTDKSAVLQRDDTRIGLAVNGEDPEQTSCYISVSDVEALRADLADKGVQPSDITTDQYGGELQQIFFAAEPFGVCFCFGQKQGHVPPKVKED